MMMSFSLELVMHNILEPEDNCFPGSANDTRVKQLPAALDKFY